MVSYFHVNEHMKNIFEITVLIKLKYIIIT